VTVPEEAATKAATESPDSIPQPLAGLRVIDTTQELGELAARLLADLGADVVRVEPPGGGASRSTTPLTPDGRDSLHYAYRNAGKRCIALDYTVPRGREVFLRLLANADVWIDSEKPGRLDELSLSPGEVRESLPKLIVASISDFGQDGPYRDFEGSEMIGYAMGGMLYRAGAEHRPPVMPPGSHAYDTASVSAVFAVLSAVLVQKASGAGQCLDISVQEAVANLADWTIPVLTKYGAIQHRSGAGTYPIYPCRNGWVRIVIFSRRHWEALLDWMGRPEALADPALAEVVSRLGKQAEVDTALTEFFGTMDAQEAAREAQRRGLAATPLLYPGDVLDNEHTNARETFRSFEMSPGNEARFPSGFMHFDGVRMGPRARAPVPGQDRDRVLGGELDLDEAALDELAQAEVI
jgi:crotonobetainyl-CoA:carnitine CoA-transferase CaiB-like acyl-CoA transferase